MHRPGRHERALAVPEEVGLLADRHLGAAGDDHPVLGAVVVHLQREPAVGGDGDPLDPVGPPLLQVCVGAPGPVDLRVERRPGVAPLMEGLCNLAHPLCLIPAGDQDRILRLNDREVVDPDGRDQAVADDQVVAGVDADVLAPDGVVVAVLREAAVEGVEVPDVVPIGLEGNDRRPPGLLHDPVVDGDLRRLRVGLLGRVFERLNYIRGEGRTFGEEEVGVKEEHPGVPEVAVCDVPLRGREVRLLHEGVDGISPIERLTGPDVAVAGVG